VLLILSKILIVVSVTALLRCSEQFRRMSRETDELAFTALKRIMQTTEDCGYPRHLIPVLIALTALSFMLSSYITMPAVR